MKLTTISSTFKATEESTENPNSNISFSKRFTFVKYKQPTQFNVRVREEAENKFQIIGNNLFQIILIKFSDFQIQMNDIRWICCNTHVSRNCKALRWKLVLTP